MTYTRSVGVIRALAWVGVFGIAAGFATFLVLSFVAWALVSVFNNVQGGSGGAVDEGTTPLVLILAVSAALYAAGRLLVETAREYGLRQASWVRRFALPAGAAIVLGYVLLVWAGPLNWISVVALILLPAWWIVGIGPVRLPHWAGPGRVAVALAMCALVAFAGSYAATWHANEPAPGGPDPAQAQGPSIDRIAAEPPASMDMNALILSSAVATGGPGRTFVSVVLKDRTALAGWQDLRAEAWREGGKQGYFGDYFYWFVDPNETEPLSTGQVQWVDGAVALDGFDLVTALGGASVPGWGGNVVTLSGELRVHPTTRPITVVVAITGVAPDGHRYLIGNPNVKRTRFDGTTVDWFREILAGTDARGWVAARQGRTFTRQVGPPSARANSARSSS
jgi:hypothetical protein